MPFERDESPQRFYEGQRGQWRQVLAWVPRRLPSGRVEYAAAGTNWVQNGGDDTGEEERSTEVESEDEIEETSSVESWYSGDAAEWEIWSIVNGETGIETIRRRAARERQELQEIYRARREAIARGELSESEGSLESWYEEDTDEENGDDEEKGKDDDDDKSGDDRDSRDNDDDKKHDDDNDAEEPPGVWHTSTSRDIIIDEPVQHCNLREEPRPLVSLVVGEESGQREGEAGEAGAPTLARQVPINVVNSRNTSTPLSSHLSTSPHAREPGYCSPQQRTTPEYNPNSGAPLDRSSTSGVGLQSSPQASLRISPVALPAFDSSPASPEHAPIQGISNSSMASSIHEMANGVARTASAMLPPLTPPSVSPTPSAVENIKEWHPQPTQWENRSRTEQWLYNNSPELTSNTIPLPSSRRVYLPAGMAVMDLFSNENPITKLSDSRNDLLHGYSQARDLNPIIPTPESMTTPASNQSPGAGEDVVKEIEEKGPYDEVDMKFKQDQKSEQNTKNTPTTHPDPTLHHTLKRKRKSNPPSPTSNNLTRTDSRTKRTKQQNNSDEGEFLRG